MFLVLAHDQVVGFEEQALDDAQSAPAPGYEVGDVVSGEEGARLGTGERAHQGQFEQRRGDGRPGLAELAHLALPPGHVLLGVLPHTVGVLQHTNLASAHQELSVDVWSQVGTV